MAQQRVEPGGIRVVKFSFISRHFRLMYRTA
jgi:hypothetical protein